MSVCPRVKDYRTTNTTESKHKLVITAVHSVFLARKMLISSVPEERVEDFTEFFFISFEHSISFLVPGLAGHKHVCRGTPELFLNIRTATERESQNRTLLQGGLRGLG